MEGSLPDSAWLRSLQFHAEAGKRRPRHHLRGRLNRQSGQDGLLRYQLHRYQQGIAAKRD